MNDQEFKVYIKRSNARRLAEMKQRRVNADKIYRANLKSHRRVMDLIRFAKVLGISLGHLNKLIKEVESRKA